MWGEETRQEKASVGAQGKRGTNEESDTADRVAEIATQVLVPTRVGESVVPLGAANKLSRGHGSINDVAESRREAREKKKSKKKRGRSREATWAGRHRKRQRGDNTQEARNAQGARYVGYHREEDQDTTRDREREEERGSIPPEARQEAIT